MESYPKFHNEVGVPIVRIGCREFKCIGDKPPQDHPHIYLKMGDACEIVCPYCSTLFRFDPSLGAHEADPADCALHHLRHAARIVAVGLVDLRLQHRPHVPRLDTDYRQACFGKRAIKPLR